MDGTADISCDARARRRLLRLTNMKSMPSLLGGSARAANIAARRSIKMRSVPRSPRIPASSCTAGRRVHEWNRWALCLRLDQIDAPNLGFRGCRACSA